MDKKEKHHGQPIWGVISHLPSSLCLSGKWMHPMTGKKKKKKKTTLKNAPYNINLRNLLPHSNFLWNIGFTSVEPALTNHFYCFKWHKVSKIAFCRIASCWAVFWYRIFFTSFLFTSLKESYSISILSSSAFNLTSRSNKYWCLLCNKSHKN